MHTRLQTCERQFPCVSFQPSFSLISFLFLFRLCFSVFIVLPSSLFSSVTWFLPSVFLPTPYCSSSLLSDLSFLDPYADMVRVGGGVWPPIGRRRRGLNGRRRRRSAASANDSKILVSLICLSNFIILNKCMKVHKYMIIFILCIFSLFIHLRQQL
jgi:hypothetical protein